MWRGGSLFFCNFYFWPYGGEEGGDVFFLSEGIKKNSSYGYEY